MLLALARSMCGLIYGFCQAKGGQVLVTAVTSPAGSSTHSSCLSLYMSASPTGLFKGEAQGVGSVLVSGHYTLWWLNPSEKRHQYAQIHSPSFGDAHGLWVQPGPLRSQAVSIQRASHPGLAPAFLPPEPSLYARSVFFSDCFF